MVQCPHNSHHYIPEDSLGKHSQTCPYSSFNMDKETIQVISERERRREIDNLLLFPCRCFMTSLNIIIMDILM